MNIIYIFGIILIGLLVGKGLRWISEKYFNTDEVDFQKYVKGCIYVVLLFLNPIILFGAFWSAQLHEKALVYIPLFGFVSLVLGGMLAIFLAKVYRLGQKQTGSMFVSSATSNLGTLGTFICFIFLGEESLVYVALFKLLEELFYYTICFPIARRYGDQTDKIIKSPIRKILTDPFIIVTFSVIFLGTIMTVSPWDRPEFYSTLNQLLVPIATILLMLPIGFNLKVKAIRGYIKESFSISLIKYIVVPVVITGLAYVLGVGNLHDGLVLKVVFVLSAMPPAVTSLVPPQLFNLDLDLANSSWLVNTGLMFPLLPIILYIVSFL